MNFEECEFSGLMAASCAHCTGAKEDPEPSYGNGDIVEFEAIGARFRAKYPGYCTLDFNHKIRRDDIVTRVQRTDNPMLPVTGVACAACTKFLPRVR